jgi:maleate isomerase
MSFEQLYGWRGRVGLILPADNVVTEPELAAAGISGLTFHGLRLTATEHDAMRAQALDLADVLVELGVDIAVYACAETSFNAGETQRQSLDSTIAERSGRPVVTATNAMLAALAALGVSAPALITPYTPRSGDILEATLRDNGREAVRARHRDFRLESDDPREWFNTNRQPVTEAYRMARGIDGTDADGILIASTNLPTFGIIEQLERDAGKPVVTSNQAILWWCLQTLGLDPGDVRLGMLLGAPMRSEAVVR